MSGLEIHIEGINPHPWEAPRGKTQSGQLVAYKQALKEELNNQILNIATDLPLGPYYLELYFWRQLEAGTRGSGRNIRGHVADATNLQKATEDCLQGILFDNDRDVQRVTSEIVSQSFTVSPLIVIILQTYIPSGELDYLTKEDPYA